MKKLKRILFISMLIICTCIITGCTKPEVSTVQATVKNKEYIKAHKEYGYFYDTLKGDFRWKYKNFPEEYNVTVQYNDIIETYDNKSLYDSVENGGTIDVKLSTYYNSKGEILKQFISIK